MEEVRFSKTASIRATIELSSEVVGYIRRATGATKERKRLRDKIRACEFILQRLVDEINDADEGKMWWEMVEALENDDSSLGRLRDTLTDIKTKFEPKNETVNITALDEQEVENMIPAIEHTETALTSDCRLVEKVIALNEESSCLVQPQQCEEQRAILNWLTSVDYAPKQNDFISRRQAGTGQYFLGSNEFLAWVGSRKQTLVCQGLPGAGKTIITATVVDKLCRMFHKDTSVGIAYLYCNFQRQYEQTARDLLASLLKQLVQGKPSVPNALKTLYDRHQDKQTRPSLDEISRCLYYITATYSRAFIIIDALDECAGASRARLLSEILDLQDWTGANLFTTSRLITGITDKFKEVVPVTISTSSYDIRSYLESRMSRLPSSIALSPTLQEEVKNRITQAAGGIFLLAQLHFDSLIEKELKTVRAILDKLPTAPGEAYDYAYRDAMNRIQEQSAEAMELAQKVLSWVALAKRPLTTSELKHALAVDVGDTHLNKDNLPVTGDMITACAGLVTVDKESDIIRLVHDTAYEYLQRTYALWFPTAETEIATVCVTYLSFDDFNAGFCGTDNEFEVRLRSNVLYDYAARNWGDHARTASMKVTEPILRFLESQAKVSSSSQAMLASRGYSGYSQRVPKEVTGIHLAAHYGLKQAIIGLVTKNHSPSLKDSYGRTPLAWAAIQGHDEVVSLLLAEGVESSSENGQTPLSLAAANGHEAVVQLLISEGAGLESTNDNGQTPLSIAAENGHEVVVKLLLAQHKLDPDSKDNYGQTPLSLAARKGHKAVVELLLAQSKVDPDSKDINDQTPLSCAAESGRRAVVELLLAQDRVDPESKDTYNQTPLSLAAKNGHNVVVELLLAQDEVDPDSKDINYQTPLSCAAKSGHGAVVELLLAQDRVDPDSKDNLNQTPLSLAAENGHEAVVELLLAQDNVDPDHKNAFRRTPLSLAAELGHKAVVELLLANEQVVPDFKAFMGRTPMSFAAEHGHEAVVQLLLSENVDLDSIDVDGRTPILWAAANGHDAVVQLLLVKGAEFNFRDNYNRTPLLWAAQNGHETAARLLLEKGADMALMGIKRYTPLYAASANGRVGVVRLLLEKGVDTAVQDNNHRTPLYSASQNRHLEVVKALLEKGADATIPSKNGWTPVTVASKFGHLSIVQLLLGHGADLTMASKNGCTPLFMASKNGHLDVDEFLLAMGADVAFKTIDGWTPLLIASKNGFVEVVKLLLDNGADVAVATSCGRTPLYMASKHRHIEVVRLLRGKGASRGRRQKDTAPDTTQQHHKPPISQIM